MVEVLKTISIAVITNGAVLGLFIWVFKKLFESSLNKRTELFKREIELINQKNFYQFSKLYDEQAQTVKNVYAELVHGGIHLTQVAPTYSIMGHGRLSPYPC